MRLYPVGNGKYVVVNNRTKRIVRIGHYLYATTARKQLKPGKNETLLLEVE